MTRGEKPVTKSEVRTLMNERFEKQERILEQALQQQKEEIVTEITAHMGVLVENVKAEAGGAYRDELHAMKEKVEDHEHRISVLEQ